jgi:hypothetical protein
MERPVREGASAGQFLRDVIGHGGKANTAGSPGQATRTPSEKGVHHPGPDFDEAAFA